MDIVFGGQGSYMSIIIKQIEIVIHLLEFLLLSIGIIIIVL